MKARAMCELCGGRLDPIWETHGVHRACWLEVYGDGLEDEVGCATCLGIGLLTGSDWVMECPICHPRAYGTRMGEEAA